MMTFKHNAMTPDEIIESLNEHNRLFIFVSEGLLKGIYTYKSILNATMPKLSTFSSHMDYRLKGIAFDLFEYGNTLSSIILFTKSTLKYVIK